MATLYLPYTLSTSGCGSGVWRYDPHLTQKRIDKVRKSLSSAFGCKTEVHLSDSDKFVYNPRTNRYEITHSIAVACLRMNSARARQTLLFSQPEYASVTIRALRVYMLDESGKLKKIVSKTLTKIMARTDVQIVCLDYKCDVSADPVEFENECLIIDISGLWQSVECARIAVLVFLDELAGLFVDTLTVEAYLHPIIAGRKRVALNSIMHDTLTNIYFPAPLIGVRDVPYRFVSTIYITGSPENVQTAKTCLEEAAARHRETTKYLRIPCIPRKLDWMCTEHRDYLFKLMCDNATHITVPPRGSGDPILTLIGSQQVGINRTLRMITRVVCTFYVIKIFIDQGDSTARVEVQKGGDFKGGSDQATADLESHISRSSQKEKVPDSQSHSSPGTPSSRILTTPHKFEGNSLDDAPHPHSSSQRCRSSSPSITFHSAHSPSPQVSPHLSGTSYGTPQICHSSEIKFKKMSSNSFKTYHSCNISASGHSNQKHSDDIIIYNTQEMNDFIRNRNSLSSHMLTRDVCASPSELPNSSKSPRAQASAPSRSKSHSQSSGDAPAPKSMTFSSRAVSELLKIAQITGAEILHERDMITIYGNEFIIKKAHKLMAQLHWLNSTHRLIVYQLELAAENREFVNGKKNGKINKIVKASGCNIVFQEPYNDYNVLIEVQANQFSKAHEGLSYLENEIPAETSFYIPESYHKRIIGVSGKNIQKIMKKFAVYIKFTNSEEFESLGGYFENIDNVIARTPAKNVQNLENLRSAVFEQLGSSYKQRATVALAIPQAIHRLIIGRQACNLRDITCCYDIQVVLPYKESGSNYVYIMGTDQQASLATDMLAKLVPKIHSFKIPCSKDAAKTLLKKFFEFTYYLFTRRGVEIYTSAPSHVSMDNESDDPDLYINLVYMPQKKAEMEKIKTEILDFFSGNRALPLSENTAAQEAGPSNTDVPEPDTNITVPVSPMATLSLYPDAPPPSSFSMYNCFDYKLLPFPASCEEETSPTAYCVPHHSTNGGFLSGAGLPKPIQNSHPHAASNLWSGFDCENECSQSALPIIPAIPYTIPEDDNYYLMQNHNHPHHERSQPGSFIPPYYTRGDARPQSPHHPTSCVYPRLEHPYIHNPFYYPIHDIPSRQRDMMDQPRYLSDTQYDNGWPAVHQRTPPNMRSFYDDGVSSYVPQDVDDTIQQLVMETSELSTSNNEGNLSTQDAVLKTSFNPIASEQTSPSSRSSVLPVPDNSAGNSPLATSSSSMLQRLASDFFSTTPLSSDDKEQQKSNGNISPELRKKSACQSFFSEENCLRNTIKTTPNHTLRHTHQTPQRVGP